MTLCRFYAARKPKHLKVDLPTLQSFAQMDLRRKLFDQWTKLREAFRVFDEKKTGLVDVKHVRAVLRSCPVPLPEELQDAIIDRFPRFKDDNCCIRYEDLIRYLNFNICPVPPRHPMSYAEFLTRPALPLDDGVMWVRFAPFLNDLGYEGKPVVPTLGRKHDIYGFYGESDIDTCGYGAEEVYTGQKGEPSVVRPEPPLPIPPPDVTHPLKPEKKDICPNDNIPKPLIPTDPQGMGYISEGCVCPPNEPAFDRNPPKDEETQPRHLECPLKICE